MEEARGKHGQDGEASSLEGWVERRARPPLQFLWHKRWAVLRPRATQEDPLGPPLPYVPPLLLFFKKPNDRRPELVVNLEGKAVLVVQRDKPTFKLAYPRAQPILISLPSPQELHTWMAAIMEEIELGSSSRLPSQGVSHSASHTIKDKEIGEWTVLDEDLGDEAVSEAVEEDEVPNNSSLGVIDWEKRFDSRFRSLARVEFSLERLEYLYRRYSEVSSGNETEEDEDEDEECIKSAGIELMCNDVGVDPDDARVMALTWRLSAKSMGVFTHTEFISGLRNLKVDSLPKLRSLFTTQLPSDLMNPITLKDIWQFSFTYAKTPTAKVIDLVTAEVLVTLLLQQPEKYPHMHTFLDFLHKQSTYKSLNMDQWINLLDFLRVTSADLSNYDETAAWPAIFDDYVAWFKKEVK